MKDDNKIEKISAIEEEQLDIAKNVSKIVKGCMAGFANDAKDKLKDIMSGLEEDVNQTVRNLFEERSHFMLCLPDLRKTVWEFPYQKITESEAFREYWLLFLGVKDCYGEKLLEVTKYYEEHFREQIPKKIKEELSLTKGNCYAVIGKKEQAGYYYREAIKALPEGSVAWAWACQGLSNLYEFHDERRIELLSKAAEGFYLNGAWQEVIRVYLRIALYYKRLAHREPKAMEIVDRGLGIAEALREKKKNAMQQEYIELLCMKAELLEMCNDLETALQCVDRILKIFENSYGSEEDYIGLAIRGQMLAEKAGKEEKVLEYRKIVKRGERHLDVNSLAKKRYENRQEVLEVLREGKLQDLSRIHLDPENEELRWCLWLMESLDETRSEEERIRKMQDALDYVKKHCPYRIDYLEILYQRFADFYQGSDAEECSRWCKKVLEVNFFNRSARKLYAYQLQKMEKWEELEKFAKRVLKTDGQDCDRVLAGFACYQMGRFDDALSYFREIQSPSEDVEKLIVKCIQKGGQLKSPGYRPVSDTCRLDDLEKALEQFVRIVQQEQRMDFFCQEPDKIGYKWKSCPEHLGKNLLHMSLKSFFGDSVHIIEECNAGAGKIDLFVELSFHCRVVVELKMCGLNYSSDYAVSGIQQLEHYMENKNVKAGYLVVFDARKRDMGKKIPKCQATDNGGVIKCFVLDMRPTVKEKVIAKYNCSN